MGPAEIGARWATDRAANRCPYHNVALERVGGQAWCDLCDMEDATDKTTPPTEDREES